MERSTEGIRVPGMDMTGPTQITGSALDQLSCQGHEVLWLALLSHMPLSPLLSANKINSFLQNHMAGGGEKPSQRNCQGDVLDYGRVYDSPTKSTTSSFRQMIRGIKNRFYSSHLRGTLLVAFSSREVPGEVLQAKMVPFCILTTVTSSLLPTPAVSFPVPLLKWQAHEDPWAIPHPSRAQHAPSLGLQCCWEGCYSCNRGPTMQWAFQSFWASSRGRATNHFIWAAMIWHLWSGSITSYLEIFV